MSAFDGGEFFNEEGHFVDFMKVQLNQKKAQIPQMAKDLLSDDPEAQHVAITSIRKLLSIELNPPIQAFIDTGVVPRIVELLSCHEHPEVQFECAWALTNIASGTAEHVDVVVQSGALPLFVECLSSNNDDVCEQAVGLWVILLVILQNVET